MTDGKAMIHHRTNNITPWLALLRTVNGEFLDSSESATNILSYSGRDGHLCQNEIYFHLLSVFEDKFP